jgi:hypothetical protein
VKKLPVIILSALLAVSLLANGFLYLKPSQEAFIVVDFPNANSRETYFSIHRIAEAHKLSKGEGVKVGILDWGFGFQEHEGLYAGGRDFSDNAENFNGTSEHGYWMATVLKEIAPACEVYALGTYVPESEEQWVDALIAAMDWSAANGIDILTLSHQPITEKNKARFDEAVNRANANNIVTTFIHCDNPNNILPYGLIDAKESRYNREPDINIFHYDYNTLFVSQYLEYKEKGPISGGVNIIPYFSFSSMSPVTAGFIAILKGIDDSLTPAEYKDILVETSYSRRFEGVADFENGDAPRVADIGKAAAFLAGR